MKKDNFIKGAVVATVCLILTKILGAIYVIPFYAIIGSRGSVLYGAAYNIYAIFLNISTLGLPLAISKLVSEYQTLDYQYLKEKSYKLAGRIMICTAIVTTLILLIIAPILANNIIKINITNSVAIPIGAMGYAAGEAIAGQLMIDGITLVMRVSASAIIIVTLISMIRGYLQGMHYITASSISQVIEQFVRVIVIILGSYICVYVLKTKLSIAVAVAVFGATVGALVTYLYLLVKKKSVPKIKNYEIKEEEKKVSLKDIGKKIVTYTVPFIILELMGSSFQLVDMFTVVRTLTAYGFSTTDASNIMNIVTTLGIKLNLIVMSVANGIVVSLLPSLTSDYVKGDLEAVRNKINRTLQIVIYTSIPMAIGLSLLAEPTWTVFYGESFYGPRVFKVSIFVAVFASVFANVAVMLQSLSRYKKMYLALIAGFLFNAGMNIPFMILFNKIGLPMYYGNLVATMIGYVFSISICLHELKHVFKVNYKQTIIYFIYTVLASLVMTAVLLVVKNYIPITNLSRLQSLLVALLYAIIGGSIYLAITYKLGMFEKILGFKLKRKK